MVGTSGASGLRVDVETASALSLPLADVRQDVRHAVDGHVDLAGQDRGGGLVGALVGDVDELDAGDAGKIFGGDALNACPGRWCRKVMVSGFALASAINSLTFVTGTLLATASMCGSMPSG